MDDITYNFCLTSTDTNNRASTHLGSKKFINRINHQGFLLTTAASSKGNSNIYLQQWEGNSASRQVFQIQQIYRTGQSDSDVHLVLRRYKEAAGIEDVYSNYPLLRAKIWSKTIDSEDITVSMKDIRCHAALWSYSLEYFVAVVLDRVSLKHSQRISQIYIFLKGTWI